MRPNSNENKSDQDNPFNEDDDNLIYLGSMNPENTSFQYDPETCYYIFLLSRSYYPRRISMTHKSNLV